MLHLRRMTITALFSAIGIILVSLIPFSPFGAAPFLVYDLADMPVLICTLFFGPLSGALSLLIICIFQAFILGKDSIVGFTMHFISSGIMLLVLSGIYYLFRKFNSTIMLIVGLISATLAMVGAMCLLNLLITPIYMGMPREAVVAMIPTIFIPFNLIKGGLNSALTFALYKILKPIVLKNKTFSEIIWLNNYPKSDTKCFHNKKAN